MPSRQEVAWLARSPHSTVPPERPSRTRREARPSAATTATARISSRTQPAMSASTPLTPALIAGWVLLLILAVAVVAALGLASRRVLLGRSGGTVECGLRASQAASWRLGIATYEPGELQ